MRPLFNILIFLIAFQLVAQEPVWMQLEDNYPYYISYSRIGIDQFNNIYSVSDWSHPSSYERVSQIIKYAPEGNIEWSLNYQADSTYTKGVYISKIGTTYILRTVSSTYLDQFSLIFAIDSNGNEIFSHKSDDANFNDIICDDEGNVYVTGHNFEPVGENKAVIAKFNDSGILVWQSTWEEPCIYSSGKLMLISESSLFVLGKYSTNQFSSLFIAKYGFNGELIDHILFNSNPWDLKILHNAILDSENNIYAIGRYENGEEWWYKGFIYKFDSSMSELWHDTTSLDFYLFTDFKVDEDKNLILSGYENENYSDQPHATYAKYDEGGNKLWHYTNDSIKSRFNSIAIHNNNYFLTGRIWNEEKYSYDYITVRLDQNGEVTGSHSLGSIDTTYNVGIDNIIDYNGNLICTGIYEDTTEYCLTIKYNALTFEKEILSRKNETIKIYPNPSTSFLNIEINNLDFSYSGISLYKMNGQKIKEFNIPESELSRRIIQVDLNEIPYGIYILTIKSTEKTFSKKIIVTD